MGNPKKDDIAKIDKGVRNAQQKAKSRVAAKIRRQNENDNIVSLTRLVPWIPDNPPDKSTIIRLSSSYIGLKHVLNGSRNGKMIGEGRAATRGVESHSLEVLEGFVIILTNDGTITFVNEKVMNYLGFPPHEMMGKKIYNYVLRKDWELVAEKLGGPLPSMDNPNVKEPKDDPDGAVCEPEASELFVPYFENKSRNGKIQFSVRMQSNLMSGASSSKSTSFQIVRFTGRIGTDGYFMGIGEHAWTPNLGDLPVLEPAFISRLTPDLKLLFCEGRIHRYMDSEAKDIVGRVVYPFYHPTDVFHIQKTHSTLLAEGIVTTNPYRWMNKDGGWIWLKSTTTRIQDEKTGKTYMLCVNYVLSAIENKGVVVGINPETNERVLENRNDEENENDSDDAYLVNELTEAFTKSYPFGRPANMPAAISDGQGNVFSNLPTTEEEYICPFTSEESKVKASQGFYEIHPQMSRNNMAVQEPAESFAKYSWPQGEPSTWETSTILNNQANGFSLQDPIMNGQFSPVILPAAQVVGNIREVKDDLSYVDEEYERQCLEESYSQHGMIPSVGNNQTSDLITQDDEMTELFDVEMCASNETEAYEASLFLFMNEVPIPDLEANTSADLSINHQESSSGYNQDMMFSTQDLSQCYANYPQLHHDNNILQNGFMNIAQMSNSFQDEAGCLLDFDTSVFN